MPDAPYNSQDLLDAVIAQRNALMNESAMAQAVIKAKDVRIAEQVDLAKVKDARIAELETELTKFRPPEGDRTA